MKVERWTSYDDLEEPCGEDDVGTLGGWFQGGMRWEDFDEAVPEDLKPYYDALREEVIERGLQRGGDWHQRAEDGVPVFSDGKYATFSYRAWGDLLAAIWSTELDCDLNYMTFYMDDWMPDDLGA